MSASEVTNRRKLCDASALAPGTWLSRISYFQIRGRNADGSYVVRNTNGFEWSIGANIVEQECYAADQFTRTERVTRSQLAHRLKDAGHAIVQAKFRKQVTAKRVTDALPTLCTEDTLSSTAKRRRAAETLLCGEDRVMTGHLKRQRLGNLEPFFGRSVVQDLEQPEYHRSERQIDHRTLEWLIVEGVKYERK